MIFNQAKIILECCVRIEKVVSHSEQIRNNPS